MSLDFGETEIIRRSNFSRRRGSGSYRDLCFSWELFGFKFVLEI